VSTLEELSQCLAQVNFLFLVYAATFLLKLKASNSRFSQLVTGEEVSSLLLQSIADCQRASTSSKHAAGTAHIVLRVLLASWRAREAGQAASVSGRTSAEPEPSSLLSGGNNSGQGCGGSINQNSLTASSLISAQDGGGTRGVHSGGGGTQQQPAEGQGGTTTATPGGLCPQSDALDAFLSDTQLFSSALLSQGTQFLDWTANLDPTTEIELQHMSEESR
jgi:hypothetical protein